MLYFMHPAWLQVSFTITKFTAPEQQLDKNAFIHTFSTNAFVQHYTVVMA